MYRVTCNGKNLNYGKQGQRILISNCHYNSWNTKRKKDNIPFYLPTAKKEGSGRLIIKEV
jgi:hypothetical protein